jgi:hypothetical protein
VSQAGEVTLPPGDTVDVRFRSIGVLTFLAGVTAVVGCGQPSPSESVVELRAIFPVLERLQVTNYWVDDRCEYIAYGRGAFVTNPASSDCQIDLGGPYPRLPFDNQARTDIALIKSESAKHGPRLHQAFVKYAADGTITGDSWFGIGACLSYVYEPGYGAVPLDDSVEYEVVDATWYTVKAC